MPRMRPFHFVPDIERFVVGVAVVPVPDRLEPPPIDQLEKTSKDAIDVVHARPLLSLDTQKGTVCTVPAGHAPRHSESFPGQPCPCGEGLGVGVVRWSNT